jgi:hypothetical protein
VKKSLGSITTTQATSRAKLSKSSNPSLHKRTTLTADKGVRNKKIESVDNLDCAGLDRRDDASAFSLTSKVNGPVKQLPACFLSPLIRKNATDPVEAP